ncbi:MAG: hypothetical protein H3C43_10250 [Leptonema sp. (in: Bacteria)]|nr:hypothetical protein [Leptonema sp. (in: bacteria)]
MNRILEFIEFASAFLSSPQMIRSQLHESDNRSRFSFIVSILASISLATGIFYLRDSYNRGFLILIPISAILIFVFLRFYSRLFSARLLQIITQTGNYEVDSHSFLDILIEGSFLPNLFFLPLCITAKEFSLPALILIPGSLALLLWMLYIQFVGLTYTIEMDPKRTAMLLARNHLLMVAYPVFAVFSISILILSLFGVRGGV